MQKQQKKRQPKQQLRKQKQLKRKLQKQLNNPIKNRSAVWAYSQKGKAQTAPKDNMNNLRRAI